MKARALATAELIRVIREGRERDGSGDIRAAEEELIARLGGSFRHTRRVDRVAGAAQCALGTFVVLLGVAALFAGFGMGLDLIETGHMPSVGGVLLFAFAFGLGGAILVGGAAAVFGWKPEGRLGWLVGKLTRKDAAINRQGRWPEELVRVIGAERQSHSAAEQEQALAQIRQMYRERLSATRRHTRISAGLGAYAGLVGMAGLALTFSAFLRGDLWIFMDLPPFPASTPPWLSRAWGVVTVASAVGMGLTMPALLVGSVALLFLKRIGRWILIGVFWAWMLTIPPLLLLALITIPYATTSRLYGVAYAIYLGTALAFYWAILRALRSVRVRELCRRDVRAEWLPK